MYAKEYVQKMGWGVKPNGILKKVGESLNKCIYFCFTSKMQVLMGVVTSDNVAIYNHYCQCRNSVDILTFTHIKEGNNGPIKE